VVAFIAAGVLGLYLGHVQQQFQDRVNAAEQAEQTPLPVPTFTGIPNLQPRPDGRLAEPDRLPVRDERQGTAEP
jgi:hypothetical protein